MDGLWLKELLGTVHLTLGELGVVRSSKAQNALQSLGRRAVNTEPRIRAREPELSKVFREEVPDRLGLSQLMPAIYPRIEGLAK